MRHGAMGSGQRNSDGAVTDADERARHCSDKISDDRSGAARSGSPSSPRDRRWRVFGGMVWLLGAAHLARSVTREGGGAGFAACAARSRGALRAPAGGGLLRLLQPGIFKLIFAGPANSPLFDDRAVR
jgi:hypothetical protein